MIISIVTGAVACDRAQKAEPKCATANGAPDRSGDNDAAALKPAV